MSTPTQPLYDIPVDGITIPEWKVREDLPDMESLVANIEEMGGIMVPILVTPELELIKGFRRLAAAQLIGLERVPCRVIDPADPEYASISAQVHHRPLTPIEIGRYADKHWNSSWATDVKGERRAAIGRRLNCSPRHVERCRRLYLRTKENPAFASVVQVAETQGARAAEKELDRLTEELAIGVEIVELEENGPSAMWQTFDADLIVMRTHNVRQAPADTVALIRPFGKTLVSVAPHDLDAYLGEIDGYSHLRPLASATCVAGEECRTYLLSCDGEFVPAKEEMVFRGRTMAGAVRSMIRAHSKDGDLVIDPCMSDDVTFRACEGRRFAGAGDPAVIQKIREGLNG